MSASSVWVKSDVRVALERLALCPQPVYWRDGVHFLISSEWIKPDLVEVSALDVGATWLPKSWQTEQALFLGYNWLGQTVVEHPHCPQRFVRRGPRLWAEVKPDSPWSTDALWFRETHELRSFLFHAFEVGLFQSFDDFVHWQNRSLNSLAFVPDSLVFYEQTHCDFLQASTDNLSKAVDPSAQVAYQSLSQQPHTAYLPKSFEQASLEALQGWASKHSDETMDAYVSRETGLDLSRFTGEQVDAIGLAIEQLSSKKSFLLGDQTGLGKGRVLAALFYWIQKQGLIPVFFTETAALFSDFWRDLEDVLGFQASPFEKSLILHQQQTVYDPSGVAWKSTLKPKMRQQILEGDSEAFEIDSVLTTYSQFGRKNESKMAFMKRLRSRAVFLFDEAHNAAGQSMVRQAVKLFQEQSAGCVWASATFAKRADSLSFYQSILKEHPDIHDWGYWLGREDASPLRIYLSQEMVRSGLMVRREQDLSDLTYRLFSESSERQSLLEQQSDLFSQYASSFLKMQQHLGQHFRLSGGVKSDPSKLFGGRLYRLNRLMLMILSIPLALRTAQESIKMGQKPILVCETTLEQALSSNEDSVDLLGTGLRWSSFADVCLLQIRELVSAWEVSETSEAGRAFKVRQAHFEDWVIQHFSTFPPSPIDALKQSLSDDGIHVGEVSGRQNELVFENGSWHPKARLDERVVIVRRFNAGHLDALIVTLAGCSGISLHASSKFKDQKPRLLIEWQIPQNVADRVQFFGRVYRKGQIVPSSVGTLLLGLPAESRIQMIQSQKIKRLYEFTTGQTQTVFSKDSGSYLQQPQSRMWGQRWLDFYPSVAKRLGLSSNGDQDRSVLDRIYSRLILLPIAEQKNVLSFWESFHSQILNSDSDSINFLNEGLESRSTYPVHPQVRLGVIRTPVESFDFCPGDADDLALFHQKLKSWSQSHPSHYALFQRFSGVQTGWTLKWRHQERRKYILGCVLEVWLPSHGYEDFWEVAHLKVWSPDLGQSCWVSLLDLSRDESFSLESRSLPVHASAAAALESHGSQWYLQGDPVQILLWKTHHRMGQILDQDSSVLLLPSGLNPDQVQSLTWPIGRPSQALQFLSFFKTKGLLTAYDTRGTSICLSVNEHRIYTLSWARGARLDDGEVASPVFRQHFGSPVVTADGRLGFSFDSSRSHSIIYHLFSRGVCFGSDLNLLLKMGSTP